MDPVTLFMMASSAVSAVKKGCQLYKDIKGAAGDVKDVLKDLNDQFHKAYDGKPVPPEAQKQFIAEKNRVIELNKKDGETTGIYTEIGEHLGNYYDNYYKCVAIFEEEERRAKTQAYHGDASLGKRALQRVLMRKQLEQMGTELREIMVYQSPPELGALHTEVEEMMEVMSKEQKVLLTKEIRAHAVEERRRLLRKKRLTEQAIIGVSIVCLILVIGFMMMWVAYDRQQKYPQYGDGFFPKSEKQRLKESKPQVYVGR
jgi:hypothetical protein